MTEVPILGQPKGEPVTVDHPIFEEIAAAITEVLNRTAVLAQQQVALIELLVEQGVLKVDEDTDAPATDEDAAA